MKQILLILLLIIVSENIECQIINKFGIKAGILLNGMSTNGEIPNVVENLSSQEFHFISFDVGLFTEWFDSRFFNVTTELHYNVKGEQKENGLRILTQVGSGINSHFKYVEISDRFHYLSLQVMPKWKFIVTHEDNAYLFAGLKADYRIGTSNSNDNEDIKVSTGVVEPGFVVGFGNEIWDIFRFEIKYEHSFVNVYNIEFSTDKISRSINCFSFQVGLSLKKILKTHL